MIKAEDSSSMHDFMQEDYKAPEQKPKQREVNWQANRPDTSKPYVNRAPTHVKEAMRITQPNKGYYEFENLAFGRSPSDAFGNKVNAAFGGKPKGEFNFREEKQRYQALYIQMMGEE